MLAGRQPFGVLRWFQLCVGCCWGFFFFVVFCFFGGGGGLLECSVFLHFSATGCTEGFSCFVQACCQSARVTSSDYVQFFYATETGDSRMWTRSVCFAGIRRGTKTGASFFFFFFFLSPIYFPCGQKKISAESQLHCRGNLRFRGQFPCLVQRLKECWLDSDVCHSSGAVWESRWTSWAVRPNEPSQWFPWT